LFKNFTDNKFEEGDHVNISRSTDLAYLVFTLTPQTKLTVGKQSADWGGMELDLNPIDILEYNDLIEYADNYLIGADIRSFRFLPVPIYDVHKPC